MCSASTFEERSRALAACAAHGYISSRMDTPLRLRISTVVACSAGFDRAAGLGSAGAIWFACFRCLCRCSNNAARDLNPIGRQPNVARQTIHSSPESSPGPNLCSGVMWLYATDTISVASNYIILELPTVVYNLLSMLKGAHSPLKLRPPCPRAHSCAPTDTSSHRVLVQATSTVSCVTVAAAAAIAPPPVATDAAAEAAAATATAAAGWVCKAVHGEADLARLTRARRSLHHDLVGAVRRRSRNLCL